MVDSSVEKSFLYLVGLSLLLHVAVFVFFLFLPQEKPKLKQEPYMVDLREFPSLPPTPPRHDEAKRFSDERRRVEREMMRRGTREFDRPAQQQARPAPAKPGHEESVAGKPAERPTQQKPERRETPPADQSAGQDFFRPERKRMDLAKLLPSGRGMAQLEESYRKRFEADMASGDTNFLNTDDIQFGSFLRRFENAVYGVWRYPAEAARLGVEGVTPVRITFNRKGEIENIQILESSGSRILDDEVRRTLNAIGPIGSFPSNYPKEHFHLIAFFQYNISRGGMTGRLR